MSVALVGNPNSGKSTLFNALTGSKQHIGNWPGVTVEKKAGTLFLYGQAVSVVDLPGAYSLSAFSAEELITRDFILNDRPDVVVAVVDASNLERNLYLVLQLLEMRAPVVVALNMTDVAERRQIHIDREKLSAVLGNVPVFSTVGTREVGIDTLKQVVWQYMQQRPERAQFVIQFEACVEREIAGLLPVIQTDAALCEQYPCRWLAIKLLEEDESLLEKLAGNTALIQAAQEAAERIRAETGEDPDTLIVDGRYRFIGEITRGTVTRPAVDTATFSDTLDRVLAHRFWGVPIFLFFMWVVFQVTANASAPMVDWLDSIVAGPASHWAAWGLAQVGLAGSWVEALIVDGIIAGVGGVLVFVPVLFALYLALAILEETGYMARAAFVMERFMQTLGLHGKSFLPLLVGFGCSVPAIYATRTLEDDTDRRITGFLIPFMSCGARLPVYVVFGAAFFGGKAGNLIFAMYAMGVVVAVLTSVLLTRGVFRGRDVPPFMIELPSYHLPNLKMLWFYVSPRVGQFIRNAGTVIFAASIVIWFLTAIPAGTGRGKFAEVESADSVFGEISQAIAPVLRPAGFGTGEASTALMTGLLAKEVIISTMSQLYVVGGAEAAEETPTFTEDVKETVAGLGEALGLTIQELVNIAPRAVNALPGVDIGEVAVLSVGDEDSTTALETALRREFTPLQAVAFNVFVLLYIPCMATVAAMRQEFGTRWMLYQAAYMMLVAWVAAVAVYQGGLLLGMG